MIALYKIARWIYRTLAGGMAPAHLAYGLCLGFYFALLPLKTPIIVPLVVVVLVTRASVWLLMLSCALLKPFFALGLDRVVWQAGRYVLEDMPGIRGPLGAVLRAPGVALLGLDRYAVLGGVVVATVLTAVLFFPIRRFVIWFRENISSRTEQSKAVRWIMGFWFGKVLRFLIAPV